MGLFDLIHKPNSTPLATLTVATIATQGTEHTITVAKVASVTVANSAESKIETRRPATTSTTPKPAAEPKTNPAITCKGCIHFESYHAHGGGAGICNAEVMPFGACWWSDGLHQCDKYLSSASGTPAPDPLLVEVYTPSGTPMITRTDNAEHLVLDQT